MAIQWHRGEILDCVKRDRDGRAFVDGKDNKKIYLQHGDWIIKDSVGNTFHICHRDQLHSLLNQIDQRRISTNQGSGS